MILFQLERLKRCKKLSRVIVATSVDQSDDKLAYILRASGVAVFRGSLDDVLDRYLACAKQVSASTIVRLTGDCPLLDPGCIDEVIHEFNAGSWDYISNAAIKKLQNIPQGLDVEVFRLSVLETASLKARLPSEREHVTPWMRTREANYRWAHFRHSIDRPFFRLTVDYNVDYILISKIVDSLSSGPDGDASPLSPVYDIDNLICFMNAHPELARSNSGIDPSEGYLLSLSKDLECQFDS